MVQEPESCRKVVCEKDVRRMLDGQNLPAISKVLDVPYRTLWGWINESEENRQRYDEAREEQDEMISIRIDEVFDLMKHIDRHKISDDFRKPLKSWQVCK